MNIHTDQLQQNGSRAIANNLSQQKNNTEPAAQLQQLVNDSPQVNQLRAYQQMANNAASSLMQKKAGPKMFMRQAPAPGNAVVQRAVITVNADGLIGDSAQTVANVTGASAGAFAEVRDDETIYIFAHGYHSMTKP